MQVYGARLHRALRGGTIALLSGSPAIDAGDEIICAADPVNNLDQRGYVRPGVGATNCSIGAYEFNSVAATPTPTPTPSVNPAAACVGDCNADREVTIDEILALVNIALNALPLADCESGDANGDKQITVDEILAAVNNALSGCGGNALSITLPIQTAAPLSPLKIATTGLAVHSPAQVTFSNSRAGFSVQTTPFRIDSDGSVWVGVPPYVDPQNGITSGNVQVTLSQGVISSAPQPLAIQDLPTLAQLGTSSGQLSHAFYVFAAQIIANRIQELDEASVLLQDSGQNEDVSSARSSLVRLEKSLISARNDIDRILLDNTVFIDGGTTTAGVPVNVNAATVEAMDRLICG